MAYSVDSGAVVKTSGRGASRVTLRVDFKDIERWARRMQADTPRLMALSFGRACKGLKDKLHEVIKSRGGVYGVPKFVDFEEFTKEKRAKGGITTPMGGLLAEKGSLGAWGKGTNWVVGYKDHFEEPSIAFQEGKGGPKAEQWFTDPEYRQTWHKEGFANIPREYTHNKREVMPQPFGRYIDANMTIWAREVYYKSLCKLMDGKKDAAFAACLKKV